MYVLRGAGYRRDSTTSTTEAGGGPDQVEPGRLIRYAIGTTARPPLGGFFFRPILGRVPEPGHPPCDPPGAAILRESGPDHRIGGLEDSESDGIWRTKRSAGT
jgi:hypothetical protein